MAWKLLDFSGLRTLQSIINSIKKTADDNASVVSDLSGEMQTLASLVSDALEDMVTARRDFVLEASGWAANDSTAEYPYMYTFALAGTTENTRVDAVLSASSQSVAAACQMCTTTETTAGSVIFRSKTVPAGAISGQLYIIETEG